MTFFARSLLSQWLWGEGLMTQSWPHPPSSSSSSSSGEQSRTDPSEFPPFVRSSGWVPIYGGGGEGGGGGRPRRGVVNHTDVYCQTREKRNRRKSEAEEEEEERGDRNLCFGRRSPRERSWRS